MPSAPGSVGSRTSARIAPVVRRAPARGSWSPRCRGPHSARRSPLPPGLSQQFGHGGRPGTGVATRADPRQRPVVRSGPAPLDHDRGRTVEPRSRAGGARRAPAGRPGGRVAERARRGRRRRSGSRPHGTSPIAMLAAVATLTTTAPRRSGSSPSTMTARGARRRAGRPRRRRTRGPGDASSIRSIRATASSRRSRDSRPACTAATIAAWVSRTSAAALSAPMQSRSAPAASDSTAASGMPRPARRAGHVEGVADDHAVVPQPVAQQPQHRRAQGRRAARGRWRGRRCARSSPRRSRPRRPPRTAPARGRRGSPGRRRPSAARGGCPGRCRRGPGSAWRRRRRRPPAGRRPRPRRGAATRAGSAPKLRVPITGLSGLLLTSATGPKSRLMPTAASSAPMARPVSRVSSRSSAAPSAAGAEHRAAVEGVQPGDVAALLVDGDDGARVGGPDRGAELGDRLAARRRCCCRSSRPRRGPRRAARRSRRAASYRRRRGAGRARASVLEVTSSLHRPGGEAR